MKHCYSCDALVDTQSELLSVGPESHMVKDYTLVV